MPRHIFLGHLRGLCEAVAAFSLFSGILSVFITHMHKILMHSGYISFITGINCKYVLLFCGLPFHHLNGTLN